MSSIVGNATDVQFHPTTIDYIKASPSLLLGLSKSLDSSQRWAIFSTLFALWATWHLFLKPSTKVKAPIIGGRNGLLSSYITALQFVKDGNGLLSEGYRKYKHKIFQIPKMDGWLLVIAGGPLVDELRKAPDDTLSFVEAVSDQLQVPYTLGKQIDDDLYHVDIIRSQLTRNLSVLFPEVRDEIAQACEDELESQFVEGEEWISVPGLETIMRIVSRASNRIFVGLPKCRDPEYRDLNITFTKDVALGGAIINLFPNFLKPVAARFMTNVPAAIKQGEKHLVPIIEERWSLPRDERPNDMLTWLIDGAQGVEATARSLTLRMLTVNFAAIHTSSMSFTHALFHLAARPEYIAPLRAEIEAVVEQYGWEKLSMQKMRKLDSFMKESQRYNGLGNISMTRKALVDYTFSDGTFVPKGSHVSAVATPMHYDNSIYPNGHEFQGFRFSEMRDEDGEGVKHQMVTTTLEYIPFGHGRHACPGRFFAVNELKCVMAHMILHYDIKFEEEGVRPPDLWFGSACVPNTSAKVMFRKRVHNK